MQSLERLKWAVTALAQPAEVQLGLFPEFAVVADELALNWEEALDGLASVQSSLTDGQADAVCRLDGLIVAISGPRNEALWEIGALRSAPEWTRIRSVARETAEVFGWPTTPPPRSEDIYIGGTEG